MERPLRPRGTAKLVRSSLRASLAVALAGLTIPAGACAPGDDAGGAADLPLQLGPIDGHDLPGADPDRIMVGAAAPDFRLESYRGDTLSLTDYRGTHEVILVFYRGSW